MKRPYVPPAAQAIRLDGALLMSSGPRPGGSFRPDDEEYEGDFQSQGKKYFEMKWE